MRFTTLLIGLLVTVFWQTQAAKSPVDSLRHALAKTSVPAEQIPIYRNLADATYETAESCGYLIQLVDKAHKARQTRPMMEAFIDLTSSYIQLGKIDSAQFFLAKAETYAPSAERDQWCCYLRMRLLTADLLGEQAEQVIEDKIAEFRERDIAQESPYRQIEAEFILGSVLYDKAQCEEAHTHIHNALKMAQQLPFHEGAPYQLLIMRQLSRIHNTMRNTSASAEVNKQAIAVKEKYYEQYDKKQRPFYPMDDFYISSYAALMINVKNQPDQESQDYLRKLIEMSDRSGKPTHKYSRFLAQYNYSAYKRQLRQSLIYNDSLIRYARQIAVYNLPGLYRLNATLHEMLGEDKPALENLRESYRLQDSIRESDTQERFNKLRVEYDLNRLNYEKSQLELRNKVVLLVTMSILLAIAAALCVFLYHHLRRERKRKEHMQWLKLRAEESEKLKTVFINSICHEIRTPLNGIVGFAGLLLDPSLDEEERNTFPEEIQRNTTQLVSLVDSMLEVANLDVSDKELPRTPVDLIPLCRAVFDKFQTNDANSKVESILQLPNGPLMVSTNRHYLSLVLENLLANAYKFTTQGHVTLCCEHNDQEVVLSVTDTGCGIPSEKHAMVFERFTKLSEYSPGSGLGLYLCKLITSRLLGRVYIDPSYQPGTRMVVVITSPKPLTNEQV